MIDVSNKNVSGCFLLLEMAFDTKRSVALIQETLVDGAVRRMADDATLAQRFMLVDKRAALLRVTLEAGLVFAQKRKAAGFEFLLDICRRALNRDALVYLMTISAAHFAFEHGMVMRQRERCANFEVTLETCFRRLSWIYDGAGAPARFDVQTPGTVARLAAHVFDLLCSCPLCLTAFSAALVYNFRFFCLQSRVGCCSEIAHDLFVTGRAFL